MKPILSPHHKQLCLTIGLLICAVILLLNVVERRGCAQGCIVYPPQDPRDFAWRHGAHVIVNINPNNNLTSEQKEAIKCGFKMWEAANGRYGNNSGVTFDFT